MNAVEKEEVVKDEMHTELNSNLRDCYEDTSHIRRAAERGGRG